MADSTRRRYSGSPPYEAPSRSRSRSRSRSWSRPRGRPVSRSRSRSRGRDEAINPGNTLHVTGLSTRVTQEQLEEHFSKEGKPRSRISRGFAFITMETLEDANRCIKHLNQGRPRGGSSRDDYGYRRPARRSPPYRGGRDYSPRRSPPPYRGGRDYSPRRSPPPYRGGRDYSPRRSPPDYGGRSRRERSPPPYSPYRSPERNYGRR
ncbi:hypothetical protein Ccrd_003718 [Cynara cardunculus var. scolymus]|uniref:RRM domain-containing protein n=1 Tax=Cynara cardunculus var. scolymus TaxID=59895 RepID=A0A118JVL0_CYNCS|nr:hypothetical protein Ccrd_003718 [Cynara cardunculus var. scolymus]